MGGPKLTKLRARGVGLRIFVKKFYKALLSLPVWWFRSNTNSMKCRNLVLLPRHAGQASKEEDGNTTSSSSPKPGTERRRSAILIDLQIEWLVGRQVSILQQLLQQHPSCCWWWGFGCGFRWCGPLHAFLQGRHVSSEKMERTEEPCKLSKFCTIIIIISLHHQIQVQNKTSKRWW